MDANECSNRVIGAAIEVHRTLGPGLLESAYEVALAHQLRLDGLRFSRQLPLTVEYKGVELLEAYRIDLLVEECIVVEIKAVERLLPIHAAQLATYLRFSAKSVGLLLNFNATSLRSGIRRIVRPA